MARKGKAPPRHEVTKRRLARWQRERRRRRITIALGMLVVAIVIVIIGYGMYATVIAPSSQLLSTVNGTAITAADYREALRLYPYLGSPEAPLLMLEGNELVRQGAGAYGIIVTDDEVTQEIRLLFEEGGEPLSDTVFQERYQQMLSSIGISAERFRWFIAADLLQEKLDQYLRDQVPEVGALVPQVHVQTILVDTEEDAAAVVGKLDEGEDFPSLAEGYKDGDLGWLPRGIMSPDFDAVAFSTAIGERSEPFSTAEGYYIIKVVEGEDRALDEDVKGQLEANAFSYWLEEETGEKVERKVGEEDLEKIYQWAIE